MSLNQKWSNPERESVFQRLDDFSHEEEEMEIEGILGLFRILFTKYSK